MIGVGGQIEFRCFGGAATDAGNSIAMIALQ